MFTLFWAFILKSFSPPALHFSSIFHHLYLSSYLPIFSINTSQFTMGKAGRIACIFTPYVLTIASLICIIMVGLGCTKASSSTLNNLYFIRVSDQSLYMVTASAHANNLYSLTSRTSVQDRHLQQKSQISSAMPVSLMSPHPRSRPPSKHCRMMPTLLISTTLVSGVTAREILPTARIPSLPAQTPRPSSTSTRLRFWACPRPSLRRSLVVA